VGRVGLGWVGLGLIFFTFSSVAWFLFLCLGYGQIPRYHVPPNVFLVFYNALEIKDDDDERET